MAYYLPKKRIGDFKKRYRPKRRDRQAIASMRCTTAYGLERWLSERAEGLPDRGQSRPVSAPQVAVCQIGHPGFRGNTLPRPIPIAGTGLMHAGSTAATASRGESLNSGPRAGCGKTARPVR